ncbi:MAG: hypothetical protein NTW87_28625 [Planctomycetota bacterium]|nr:hypothetical protein [Planctomycetota bacterium]
MFDLSPTWSQQMYVIAVLAAENGRPLWELHDEAPPPRSTDSPRSSARASARASARKSEEAISYAGSHEAGLA